MWEELSSKVFSRHSFDGFCGKPEELGHAVGRVALDQSFMCRIDVADKVATLKRTLQTLLTLNNEAIDLSERCCRLRFPGVGHHVGNGDTQSGGNDRNNRQHDQNLDQCKTGRV